MNASTSECSSGCESGWTMYLDHISNSTDPYFNVENYQKGGGANHVNYEDQEDEDLSMVSDASSAPPPHGHGSSQFHYYGYANENSVSEGKKKSNKQRNKTKDPKVAGKQQSLCLDDTASSPVFDFSQDNVAQNDNYNAREHVPGYSQAYSAAQFENESVTKKHLGFFKSSTKGKSSSLLGRKRQ